MTSITQQLRPWAPDSLAGQDTGGFSYLVVDEIEGGGVGLSVSRWPQVDEQGRLRFPSPPVLLGADRAALERFLAEHRRPPELAERPLRIGDVFAARADAALLQQADDIEARLEPVLDPEAWIVPPVSDITPDARDAAKVSFYASVVPALGPAEVARIQELVDRPPPPPPSPAPPPPPPPQPGWLRAPLLQIVAAVVVFGGGLGAGVAVSGGGKTVSSTQNVTNTVITTRTDITTSTEFTTSTNLTTLTEFTTSTLFTTSTVFTTVEVPPPPPPVG